MASIRKRGNSYQITVSKGYDIVGKKLLETTTFTPDPSWGKRQAERELRLFADEFERDMLALVSTYIFSLLAIVQADIWMQERKEKRYGKYERGEGGSAGHKEDKVSAKAG